MSKIAVFLIVAALCIAAGVLASVFEEKFLADKWSQLFWLFAATLATTFVLGTVLDRNDENRRRKNDNFAFRAFTAYSMATLRRMVTQSPPGSEYWASASEGNSEFAAVAKDVCADVVAAAAVSSVEYNAHYGEINSFIQDVARNYIRIFSTDPSDMVTNYTRLQDLASLWRYRDALTEQYQQFTSSLDRDGVERDAREKETMENQTAVAELVRSTVAELASLAHRVATIKPYYN